ncbi:MAG: hypothetical protein QW304_02800 [Thermoproteota archaeon]
MTYAQPRLLAKKVASLAVLTALAISSNYALITFPNVKLMDTIVFAASMAMGLKFGVSLSILIWIVYGTLNPYGFNLPTLIVVMLSEMIYVLFSVIALRLRSGSAEARVYDSMMLGSIGLFSTLIYDLVTNAFTGLLFYGSVLIGLLTMNFPIPMGIIHEASNALLFPIAVPIMYRAMRGGSVAYFEKNKSSNILEKKEASHYRRMLVITALFFTTLLVGETLYLASLKAQLDTLVKEVESITLRVSLLVKYDNGTETWFNNTVVPVGWTLLNLTAYDLKGRVDYEVYSFGTSVTGINGVSQHENYYWLWYKWNPEEQDWVVGETGPDAYILKNGDVLAWYLADVSKYPNIDKP